MKTWDDRMDGLMDWCEKTMQTPGHAKEMRIGAAQVLLEALKVQPERSGRQSTPDSTGGDGEPMRTVAQSRP